MIHDVQHQIRAIQLYTKRLMQANLFGRSKSMQKGDSLEFDQIRDYQLGDDVRSLDWKSSARINKLLVKQFYEEKHCTILIALDISASTFFGSEHNLKIASARQIAALLSYAAFLSKDEVGLLLFSEDKEWYIPPRMGKDHIYSILQKIFSFEPQKKQTNLAVVLDSITRLRKKNMMLFIISDFIDTEFEKQLALVAQQHDTIAIRIADLVEYKFDVPGLITVQDCETNQEIIIKAGPQLADFLKERMAHQKKICIKNRVDVLDIILQKPAIDQLIHFFQLRKR